MWMKPAIQERDEDGRAYYAIPAYRSIKPQADDLQHQVRSTDRIDLLATLYYQNSRLWWPILVANGIDDPLTGLVNGTTLIIPSPRYVRESLLR
jgi:hypothetical protein